MRPLKIAAIAALVLGIQDAMAVAKHNDVASTKSEVNCVAQPPNTLETNNQEKAKQRTAELRTGRNNGAGDGKGTR